MKQYNNIMNNMYTEWLLQCSENYLSVLGVHLNYWEHWYVLMLALTPGSLIFHALRNLELRPCKNISCTSNNIMERTRIYRADS